MHPRVTVPEPVRRLADLQAGVVTRAQALALGVSDAVRVRLLRDGAWGRVAAGHLHGLVADAPMPIEVLVPATGPYRARGPWRFTRERPDTRSGRSVGSPPRLPVEDTVLDLSAAGDEGQVVALVTAAVQSRRTRRPGLACGTPAM